MYPHNIYQNQKNTIPDKSTHSCVQLKVLLHVPAVIVIYYLTAFFSETALQVCRPGIPAVTLYVIMDLCSLLAVIVLYSKYILKAPAMEMNLGKPYPSLSWCMAAVLLPAAADLFYLLFINGTLHAGGLWQQGLIPVLYSDICSIGMRAAVSDGALFRGFTLYVFQRGFQKKHAALLSSLLYACIPLIPVNGSGWYFHGILQQTAALFLTGYALSMITLETGSIWSSVAVHAGYKILSGDSHILHISTEQAYPAIWTYTLDNDSRLTAGIPGIDCLYTALPAMMPFIFIILLFYIQRCTPAKRSPYGTQPDTNCGRRCGNP